MDYKKIKLLGGAEVTVDFDNKRTACKKCGKLIKFAITANGKYLPIIENGDNWQAHFADCEFANSFRKTKLEDNIEQQENNENYLSSL